MPLPRHVQDALRDAFIGESDEAIAIFGEMIVLNTPRPDPELVHLIAERHGATFDEVVEIADRIGERMTVILTQFSSAQ